MAKEEQVPLGERVKPKASVSKDITDLISLIPEDVRKNKKVKMGALVAGVVLVAALFLSMCNGSVEKTVPMQAPSSPISARTVGNGGNDSNALQVLSGYDEYYENLRARILVETAANESEETQLVLTCILLSIPNDKLARFPSASDDGPAVLYFENLLTQGREAFDFCKSDYLMTDIEYAFFLNEDKMVGVAVEPNWFPILTLGNTIIYVKQ